MAVGQKREWFRMHRRSLLAASALGLLPAPAPAQPASARVLKFIPAADVTILDPLVTTAYPTRNHGHMVWDTLYAPDADLRPQPQLVEGHTVEDSGLRWMFTLRAGPKFHDGEPVRARDAVASIQRWMKRDTHGQTLAARVAEITVLDDRRFQIRLSRTFGPMLDALGKGSSYPCFIMPERLAANPPERAITEIIGSGPYRFKADERVSGSQIVYERFAEYVPRNEPPSLLAGAKQANFDRCEWKVLPDASTAAAALQAGEVDWQESITNDLRPILQRARGVVVDRLETSGTMAMLRPNHLHPPFNDPEMRRALLKALVQEEFVTAVMGPDPALWRTGVGCFPPGTALASDAGLAAVTGPRDLEGARRVLSTWRDKVQVLHPTEIPNNNALTLVAIDQMKKAGLNAEGWTGDWGTLLQRRANRNPPGQGGWNAVVVLFAGMDLRDPGAHPLLRGNGDQAWFGWPTSPRLESLRDAWFEAPDLPAQQKIGRDIQEAFFQDVPFFPLGQYFVSSAWRNTLTNVQKGMVVPLQVRRV
jgi:peptide/nickel transport system substrate-binding protein